MFGFKNPIITEKKSDRIISEVWGISSRRGPWSGSEVWAVVSGNLVKWRSMVIINAGCQGHADDLTAAWLAPSILPAMSLFLITALATPFHSVENCRHGRDLSPRERNNSASCYSLSTLTLLMAAPVCAKSQSLWASCFHSHCARYWPAHRFPWSLGWVYLKQPLFKDLVLILSPRSLGLYGAM